MLIEPGGERRCGVPASGYMIERCLSTDARLTGDQPSHQQRSVSEQLGPRMLAWIAAGHGPEAVADEFEAGLHSHGFRFEQTTTERIVDDGSAVPAQLVPSESVISRPRVEAPRRHVS